SVARRLPGLARGRVGNPPGGPVRAPGRRLPLVERPAGPGPGLRASWRAGLVLRVLGIPSFAFASLVGISRLLYSTRPKRRMRQSAPCSAVHWVSPLTPDRPG